MAKIIVNTENFASEKVVADIQAAASLANPNNAAEVIRDSNGKVVKILVNLPSDTPSQGLTNASNKINANLGVSTTVVLPKGDPAATPKTFDSDADATLASGTQIVYLLDVNGAIVTMNGYNDGGAAMDLTVASVGNESHPAIDGKSLFCELVTPTVLRQFSFEMGLGSDPNGLSSMTNAKIKFDLNARSMITPNVMLNAYLGGTFIGNNVNGGTTWVYNGSISGYVVTAISSNDTVNLEIEQINGVRTVKFNGVAFHQDNVPGGSTNMPLSIQSVSGVLSVAIDNIIAYIADGIA